MAQQVNFFFDWDDDVACMPTKIILFHQKTAEEIPVSTEDFAHIRSEIGKPGPHADHMVRYEPFGGSMRYFRDDPQGKRNFFLEDIMRGVISGSLRGRSFPSFQTALSNIETARNTFIITARGHSRENFIAGLRCLKKIGWIKHLIPHENIWAVSHPRFPEKFKTKFKETAPEASVVNPSQAKAEVMTRLHDLIDRKPLLKSSIRVISPDGNSAGIFHLSGFSDDDLGNYEAARNLFLQSIKAGRWPKIKFTLFFTGKRASGPKTEVLTSTGHTRPLLPNEDSEWTRIFEAKYGRSPATARKQQAGALRALFGNRPKPELASLTDTENSRAQPSLSF